MNKVLSIWIDFRERFFQTLVIIFGVSIFAIYLPKINPLSDTDIICFIGLIILSNVLAILYPDSGAYLSLNFPIIMCLIITKGPSAAMWVMLSGGLVLLRRVSFGRFIFGLSQNAIATYLSIFFLPKMQTDLILARDLWWMLLVALTGDFINNLSMSTYVSFRQHTNWRSTFINLWFYRSTTMRPLFYSSGILMAICLQAQGMLAALMAFIPAVGLFYLINTQVKLKEQTIKANTDHLTQIGNRHALFSWWKKEFPQIRVMGQKLSLLMIDIDDFKRINDRYGHDTGDRVLREVAEEVSRNLRETDWVFRYGGEEFVVVLTGSSSVGAEIVANRICDKISNLKIEGINNEQITVSVGLADLDEQLANETQDVSNELLRKSDKAMYLAKKQGKNRVCVYS